MQDAQTPQQPQATVIAIVIQWQPHSGELRIGWPNVDDTIKLGLLEMAKTSLTEARIKASQSPIQSVPAMPKLHV